jgi:perosamine synthetase
MMFAPISASLSPNTAREDVWQAWRMLFQPTRWLMGSSRVAVEKWFEKYLGTRHVLTFNSARAGLFALLRAFGIGNGDEVIVQAFTCVAVPNSVIWAGAKPIYADIDDTLNIDPTDVARKITKRTKAVIVQHTFGIPADMSALKVLCAKHKILLIEDCAHSLGATHEGKKIGTQSDAAVFSFGRDKVISSVFGGLATMATHHADAWMRLKTLHAEMRYPHGFWVLQQLLHPIAFSWILPWYRLGIGKVMLIFLQRIGLLGFPVYPEEKEAKRPHAFPAKYPNALASLLLIQLKKLENMNQKRMQIAALYEEKLKDNASMTLPSARAGSIYLRFPVLVSDPAKYIHRAARHGVLLGNWYQHVIDPKGTVFGKIAYAKDRCPRATEVANRVINLPTLISKKQALRVIKSLS